MKYVAIFMPDLLYMDDKVGDFHFIWNPQTRMFHQRCDFDTTYPPLVILEGSDWLLFLVDGRDSWGEIKKASKTQFIISEIATLEEFDVKLQDKNGADDNED